ncbi:MAG TPA: hypothetical protein VE869_16855 [Gemmatimonas sp.]|nr:hypothetical protein [Gemmatimonas sp.]
MRSFLSDRLAVAPWLRAIAVFGVAAAAGACSGDEVIDPPFKDAIVPRVSLSKGTSAADTLLSMGVNASDNIGIKTIRVLLSGGVTSQYDTTFSSAVTSANIPLSFRVPSSARLGSTVSVRAIVLDGASNQSDTARLILTVGNLEPPSAVVTSPVTGSPVVSGKSIVLSISAKARYKVTTVGYQLTGAFNLTDSIRLAAPLRDSVAILDTLVLPDSVRGLTLTVTPFVTDSLNQRVPGTPAVYAVQSPANANTIPMVRTGVAARLEISDTVFVEATDPVGISVLGYEVRNLAGALVAADSISSTGAFSTLLRTFRVRLPITQFPTAVTVAGFARNANGRRDVARTTAGAILRDTVTVVAGSTNSLPDGGKIADAMYFPRTDRLFLTNIERNQVEVFNLADSSFKTPIIVGSRPWGISPWPRNRDGVMGDTLLIANSGGTNISYVNLRAGDTGREVSRYHLPNIVVFSITTVRSQTTDAPLQQRTVHDFSDRPQYIASTCTGANTPGAPCEDVVVVYSTTPTPGQTLPFPNMGTVRWENLTKRSSHFFFEPAVGQTAQRSDTLEIVRYAAQGFGSDSVLVPYKQTVTRADGTQFPLSTVVRIDALALRDTTYVRNSGNFRRAIIGEGGPVLGSRAFHYDATVGFDRIPPLPIVDMGMSRPLDVTDFISNTFARVQGVGINFDGELAAVKGDSTYIFDRTLRLQGILQSKSSIGGMDFHPLNTGLNSTPLRSRLAFVASSEPVIDIFDTFCYKKVASIPIRDPIIGPVRASVRPNGQLMLVGATVRGVTLVALPDNFSTVCF